MLGPEGSGLGGPTLIGEWNESSEDAGTRRGVNCEIPHRLEMRTKHYL